LELHQQETAIHDFENTLAKANKTALSTRTNTTEAGDIKSPQVTIQISDINREPTKVKLIKPTKVEDDPGVKFYKAEAERVDAFFKDRLQKYRGRLENLCKQTKTSYVLDKEKISVLKAVEKLKKNKGHRESGKNMTVYDAKTSKFFSNAVERFNAQSEMLKEANANEFVDANSGVDLSSEIVESYVLLFHDIRRLHNFSLTNALGFMCVLKRLKTKVMFIYVY
jgi:hypothetical protein